MWHELEPSLYFGWKTEMNINSWLKLKTETENQRMSWQYATIPYGKSFGQKWQECSPTTVTEHYERDPLEYDFVFGQPTGST